MAVNGKGACYCVSECLLQEYARFLLTRLTQSLGIPQPDEPSKKAKLRSSANFFLCDLGHQPCVANARAAFSKWMQNEDPDVGNG
jgi:hypothetical protein